MPKLKRRKSLLKRLKITKGGKLVRGRSGRSHLLSGKSGKRRRRLRRATQVVGKWAATYRK